MARPRPAVDPGLRLSLWLGPVLLQTQDLGCLCCAVVLCLRNKGVSSASYSGALGLLCCHGSRDGPLPRGPTSTHWGAVCHNAVLVRPTRGGAAGKLIMCFSKQRKEPKGEASSSNPATPIKIPDCPVPASLLEELLKPPPAVSKEPLKNLNSCLQQLKYDHILCCTSASLKD